jgi:surface-anchored protein
VAVSEARVGRGALEVTAPRTRLGLALLAVAGLAVPAANAAVALSSGHTDVVTARLESGQLEIVLKEDSSGSGVVREPEDVRLVVKPEARTSVPGNPAFGFLGAAGSAVWVLPQVQNQALLWPGWNTQEIRRGVLAGDSLRLRLLATDGPGPFALFTTDEFGSPTLLFDSDDGRPDELSVPVETHAHGNWAFGAEGTYQLTFEIAADLAGGGVTSDRATYAFDVGQASPSTTTTAARGSTTTAPAAGSGSTTTTGSPVAGSGITTATTRPVGSALASTTTTGAAGGTTSAVGTASTAPRTPGAVQGVPSTQSADPADSASGPSLARTGTSRPAVPLAVGIFLVLGGALLARRGSHR